MKRYSLLLNREIVLLKSKPCFWGKCSFCDYTNDNSANEEEINRININVLKHITGAKQALEVINSGSCFELPDKTLIKIKDIILEKNIKRLYLESHWHYRNKITCFRKLFQIPIVFKIGVETFDNYFRNKVLNKNAYFKSAEEVKVYFDSPCLLVGVKGQSKAMISRDIELLIKHFDYGTINVFTENSTAVKSDRDLVRWFTKEYRHLEGIPNIDVLYDNTGFGVG